MADSHHLSADDLEVLTANGWAERFKVVGKLGQGAFAEVLRVRPVGASATGGRTTGMDLAFKVLKPTDATGAAAGTPGATPCVLLFREARALKHARHPNVVGLHGVLKVPRACLADASASRSGRHRSHDSCWGLMLERLPGGSLIKMVFDTMANPHAKAYTMHDALTWSLDIASAVAHLHGLQPMIIHRDLKLENILLSKPSAAGGRKLPLAKLTDFGLHVMIERPPAPFMIAAGPDGHPMLILVAGADAAEHNNSGSGTSATADAVAAVSAPPLQAASVQEGSSTSSLPAVKRSAISHGKSGTAGSEKRVQFSSGTADGATATIAATAPPTAAAAAAATAMLSSSPPAQWQRLTTSSLRRLSIDAQSRSDELPRMSVDLSLPARPGCAKSLPMHHIPLLLEGRQGSALFAPALPPELLLGDGADEDSGPLPRPPLAAAAVGPDDTDGLLEVANGERDCVIKLRPASLRRVSQGSSAGGAGAGSEGHPFRRRSGGSTSALSASPAAAAAAAGPLADGNVGGGSSVRLSAAALAVRGGGDVPPSCSSASVHSSEFPTAASMMWDDMVEEDEAQEELLNGSVLRVGPAGGHSGASIAELPLSYDLTGHTGSCMTMAPEVYKNSAYNESADIFSLGVIMYELFSQTLLLYTHARASSPEDCVRYASKVAEGYRPSQPKRMPDELWDIISACWEQEPCDRPPAAWVVAQLQRVAAQWAEADAAAGRGGSASGGSMFQRMLSVRSNSSAASAASSRPTASTTSAAPPPPPLKTGTPAASEDDSAHCNGGTRARPACATAAAVAAAQAGGAGAKAADEVEPPAAPSCTCVVC